MLLSLLSDKVLYRVLNDRVFFRILSDKVPFRVLSDRLFFQVLNDRFLSWVFSPLFLVCRYFLSTQGATTIFYEKQGLCFTLHTFFISNAFFQLSLSVA